MAGLRLWNRDGDFCHGDSIVFDFNRHQTNRGQQRRDHWRCRTSLDHCVGLDFSERNLFDGSNDWYGDRDRSSNLHFSKHEEVMPQERPVILKIPPSQTKFP